MVELRRMEFHCTSEHASWLNTVEIEIGVMRGQCLDRRIDDQDWLRHEIDHGNDNETLPAPTSMDVHQPTRPARRGLI
jgi:hypothetical protein